MDLKLKKNISEYWENMIFSDESKFNISDSDGSRNIIRKKGTRYNPNNLIFIKNLEVVLQLWVGAELL